MQYNQRILRRALRQINVQLSSLVVLVFVRLSVLRLCRFNRASIHIYRPVVFNQGFARTVQGFRKLSVEDERGMCLSKTRPDLKNCARKIWLKFLIEFFTRINVIFYSLY